ncbi:TRAP transporter substrate-binding protein [Consotaella salsifontis]|uniref:Tripartite ATP-independent transporter solute receptor, DctP family n=1 Tax=Consotaella salsifontis TaxID=1365950 RepID=A0A1T4MJL8_9HYPH|nr:TRAP transporter substrate-binding protein [Consotaella salsifontis]SJZ66948.1 tripartite ATP-independent transporter solute receptor, DctP family [Consotaella salsifontis]
MGTVKMLAAVAAAATILGGGVTLAQAADTVLRAADTHPNGYPTVEAMKYMGEVLKEKTGGRIEVQVFDSHQLGEEKETIEQTKFGVIDLDRVSFAPMNNIVPETSVVCLPYVFSSVESFRKVMDGPVGEEVLKAFEPKGYIGLAVYDSGARSFYNSKRPIKTLEDMKGLKIRVQQSDLFLDMVKALGANPTPMAYGEVYSGLQTGLIDGAENNWPSYESSHHYEVAKYFSLDQHAQCPEVLMMSKISYDKLPAEDQQAVRDAAKESVKKMRELWDAQEEKSRKIVEESGVQINDVDKAPFQEAMAPIYDKYASTPELKALLQKIRDAQK